MPPEAAVISPMPIVQMMGAYQQSLAIKAALDFDLFTHVGAGRDNARDLALACGASERGVEILADYLTVARLLQKENGHYRLSPEAAIFLDRRSPACLADTMGWWSLEMQNLPIAGLTDAVRRGGAQQVIHDPSRWVTFARAMAPMMRMPAQYIAENLAAPGLKASDKVLDIAGGHGLYGIAVAQRFPQAQVTLLDADVVGAVARENAAQAGVAARYQVRAGSALPGSQGEVPFGEDNGLILVTNFLHHFSERTNAAVLAKCRAALAPGGRVLVLDFVPNPDRISPPFPAAFSLTMLADTAEGRAYTEAEYRSMFSAAGFGDFERHDLPGLPATAMIAHRNGVSRA